MEITADLRRQILAHQKGEITEHHVYRALAKRAKTSANRQVLERIADDELRHSKIWATYTGQEARPDALKLWWYGLMGRLFGLTFAVQLMERGEERAQKSYGRLVDTLPEAAAVLKEEDDHEQQLLSMLDEERLRYIGSVVLGLNDALVELTGALAGLTLALQDTRLIALTGSITGVAAAMSMAASEYLSTKTEGQVRSPLKASVYTGVTYIVTVIVLVLPYLLLSNYYVCLACTLAAAVAIIAFFNYYISVARRLPFRRRFLEMAGLSRGVALLSFGVGLLLRMVLGVEV